LSLVFVNAYLKFITDYKIQFSGLTATESDFTL